MSANPLYENLKLYHGYLINDIMSVMVVDENMLHITLSDGRTMSYDDISRTVRNLPSDSHSMTEQECRNEFGYRLRKKMYRKGLTQNDISLMTGIARTQLSSYMNGKHTPSLYIVDKIAKALGCSIDDFTYR